MRPKLTVLVLSSAFLCGLPLVAALRADDAKAKEKVTYADHVVGIFRSRCGTCHNPDKAKGGLNLDSYGAAMQGGGSGKVIEPGDAESSSLLGVITHKEEPKMPPNSAKIPDAEIEVIRKWIEGGASRHRAPLPRSRRSPSSSSNLILQPWASPAAQRPCLKTSRPSRLSPRQGPERLWQWPPARGRH